MLVIVCRRHPTSRWLMFGFCSIWSTLFQWFYFTHTWTLSGMMLRAIPKLLWTKNLELKDFNICKECRLSTSLDFASFFPPYIGPLAWDSQMLSKFRCIYYTLSSSFVRNNVPLKLACKKRRTDLSFKETTWSWICFPTLQLF